MSPTIDEFVDQLAPADQFQVMMKLANRVLAQRGRNAVVPLSIENELPIGYLFRVPPMPESDLSPEEQAAEDARRLQNLDDALTAEEMLELLDFEAAAVEGQRS
jgi:hypothetical protein